MPLRVGFDATPAVRQGGGIGRYTRELLRALAEADHTTQFRLFYASPRHAKNHALPALPDNFTVRRLPFDDIWLARVWHRAQAPVPVEWITGRINLFHSPDFTLPPTRRGTRTLLTVHDLSFVRDPESAVPVLRDYLNQVVPRSVARADHVLADSLATRADLVDIYGTPPDKISVLYCGVNEAFKPVRDTETLQSLRTRYQLSQAPFIVAVGTLQPRKNYARLIQAYAQLEVPEAKLVIAGGKGWMFEAVYAEVERLGLRERVIFPGFVADDDLPALYSAATVLAYPSTYEGFGLPILEAFACGTPVVTSTAACLPEVAGGAALLAPPTDVPALAAALRRAYGDSAERERLTQAGAARARQFTWQDSARQLLELYRRLA